MLPVDTPLTAPTALSASQSHTRRYRCERARKAECSSTPTAHSSQVNHYEYVC